MNGKFVLQRNKKDENKFENQRKPQFFMTENQEDFAFFAFQVDHGRKNHAMIPSKIIVRT